ncbi:hypothetical protein P7H16_13105 [Paenibacillus larvae]|nr:hypothetical protein [Paenibacillus larvae]MDT2247671.1 hypothetical protein [Paenibacillus larvae]
MDEVDQLLWRANPFKGYVLLDEYDAASSEKQLQMRNIWEAVAEETSEAATITAGAAAIAGKRSARKSQEYIGNFQRRS